VDISKDWIEKAIVLRLPMGDYIFHSMDSVFK